MNVKYNCEIEKNVFSKLTDLNKFHLLDVVDCVCETQLNDLAIKGLKEPNDSAIKGLKEPNDLAIKG